MTLTILPRPYRWRRASFHISFVRRDDHPHRCPLCKQMVLTGRPVITQRSADERTPGCWGPIEHMYHLDPCWLQVAAAGIAPPLGNRDGVWVKWSDPTSPDGDAYPWEGAW